MTSTVTFEFDEAFQTKIAALCVRDTAFNQRTEGLLTPEYFLSAAEGALVNTALDYYSTYGKAPDLVTLKKLIADARAKKLIRDDEWEEVKLSLRAILTADISDRDYVVDQVAEFARHQAVENALVGGVEALEKRDFDKIESLMRQALDVGQNNAAGGYDYWEKIDDRTEVRKARAAGTLRGRGISTGIKSIDDCLYHKGWGIGELSAIMGGAKAGKTTGLIEFGKRASLNGHNVLYVSLEVGTDIIAERTDASIADVAFKSLAGSPFDVADKVKEARARAGKFILHQYPSGSFAPRDLRRLMGYYKARGIVFELVIVDYADIMAPDRFYRDDAIQESKSIYTGLRAIAITEDVAMLTATQTNRDGYKATTARAEHTSEDFNKVRIVDLLISINATDEERSMGEARLFFAASRNQEGAFTLRIKQDLERMRFITKVIGRE